MLVNPFPRRSDAPSRCRSGGSPAERHRIGATVASGHERPSAGRPGVASDGKRLSGLGPISREIIRNFDSEFLKKGEEGLLCIGAVDFSDVQQAFRGETIPPGETR
jgi:hypothetical protein